MDIFGYLILSDIILLLFIIIFYFIMFFYLHSFHIMIIYVQYFGYYFILLMVDFMMRYDCCYLFVMIMELVNHYRFIKNWDLLQLFLNQFHNGY
jgi:hypothetical protein